jgi:tetratricopeptide (TPR) repeat protein
MRRLILLSSIALLSACTAAPAPQQVNQSGQRPGGPAQSGPMTESKPGAGTSEASENAPAAPLDAKVAEAKAAYDKKPGDAGLKKELVEATFQNAQFYMYKSPLPPNQKYPKALALYRQVVALDPDHAQAKDAIKIIEDIYASLGKPVPQA